MDKTYKILIVVGALFVILFGIKLIGNNSEKIDYSKFSYVEIKEERIPTLYEKSTIKHKVSDVKEGNDDTGSYIQLTYDNVSLDEVTEYIQYLGEKNYILISSEKNTVIVVSESIESGKVLTIQIDYATDKTTIKYSKGTGILTKK